METRSATRTTKGKIMILWRRFLVAAVACLLVILAAALSGCASGPLGEVSSGGAIYRYQRTADGCSVDIQSSRQVGGGSVTIDGDCSVTVEAEQIDNAGALGVIENLVNKLPGAE